MHSTKAALPIKNAWSCKNKGTNIAKTQFIATIKWPNLTEAHH